MLVVRIETPGSTGQPQVTEMTNTTVTLTWEKPSSDGGGPITGYWIEKREQNSDKWIPVNVSPCQSTHFTVPSLIEDHMYEFRVIAENEAGRGNPSDPSKLTRVGSHSPYSSMIDPRTSIRSKIPMLRHHLSS